MAATMLTTIKYYNVPDIDVTSGQAFIFDSAADREKFFAKYLVATEDHCQLMRKRSDTFKSSIPLATLETCNYMSFINPNYGNKLFYAFITFTDFLNANVSLCSIALDWWTTDMFNVEALPSRLTREGLTEVEYPTSMMSGGAYPTVNNEKFFTQEPLACDSSVEREYYGTEPRHKTSFDQNEGITYVKRDTHQYVGGTTGVCFVSPDFDKLDAENTENYKTMAKIIKKIRTSGVGYIINTPYSIANSPVSSYKTVYAYLRDPDTDQGYATDPAVSGDTTGYGAAMSAGGGLTYKTYGGTVILGGDFPAPYIQVIAAKQYIDEIIQFLNSIDMSSSVLGVHYIPPTVFPLLFNYEIEVVTSGTGAQAETFDVYNRCATGMFFPQSKQNVYSVYQTQNITSPKLMYYPYCYMTLSTMDGKNNMEYRYENLLRCKDSNGHDFNLQMAGKYDANGPVVMAAPQGYKGRTGRPGAAQGGTHSQYHIDTNEAVVDSNWPEIPYITDAFVAHMAKVSNDIIAGNTLQYQNEIGARYIESGTTKQNANISRFAALGDVALSTASALTGNGGLTEVGSSIQGAANAQANYMTADLRLQNVKREAEMSDAAYSAKGTGLMAGNAVYDNFAHTMPAFAQPNYHAGGDIRTSMMTGVEEMGIYATFHVLRVDILKKYDEFFKMYGYATTQYKIPTIFSVVDSTVPSSISTPHWESIQFADRRTVGQSGLYSRNVFYTQTENIKLSNVCKTSEEFIKRLFDGGCLFIRPITAELA